MAFTHWITYRLPSGGSQTLPIITGDECPVNAYNLLKQLTPNVGVCTHHYSHTAL